MTTTTAPSIEIDPKRLERGRAIFAGGGVTQIDASTWQVNSQTGSGYHLVNHAHATAEPLRDELVWTPLGCLQSAAISCLCRDLWPS